MARATVTAMADDNTTEMAAAMVDGNRSGNGHRQQQLGWAIVMAMVTAMATELAMVMEMATAMAMATATAKATIMKEGRFFMWRQCAALLEGRYLASTPMDTKESAFTSVASWG